MKNLTNFNINFWTNIRDKLDNSPVFIDEYFLTMIIAPV